MSSGILWTILAMTWGFNMRRCPKCRSPNWDYANVGLPYALVCLDCGNVYSTGNKTMTEEDFETKFDNGDLDCDYADFICERYDAWNKEHMLRLWDDEGVYASFKDSLVDIVVEKPQYSLGDNPLDKFPSMWSKTA
jgi:hypothetical protein